MRLRSARDRYGMQNRAKSALHDANALIVQQGLPSVAHKLRPAVTRRYGVAILADHSAAAKASASNLIHGWVLAALPVATDVEVWRRVMGQGASMCHPKSMSSLLY